MINFHGKANSARKILNTQDKAFIETLSDTLALTKESTSELKNR